VAFILQNTPLSSEYVAFNGGTALDLTLNMWEANGCIEGSLEYRADLFDPDTVESMVGCYATLAAEIAQQPDRPIGKLPLMTRAQASEWVKESQGPRFSFPRDLQTIDLIEQQVEKTPEAIAVVSGAGRLSYRELDARSNQLARRLRAMGVGRGSVVGLCVERGLDLVIAPLGVWKAGASYVPLDPEYPAQRLSYMLEDSGAAVVVTNRVLAGKVPKSSAGVVLLDGEWKEEAAGLEREPGGGEEVAYVIYTSGSTGKPKGVEVRHRSLVNFLKSMQQEPGIEASDRLLAVTTLSFDIAGLELYLPLVSGARVVVAPREAVKDGEALGRLLEQEQISVMQATPVSWRLMVEAGWKGRAGLKILCGGEVLGRELAEKLVASGGEVWNLYGPTETTIWSTVGRVEAGEGRVGIGHAIANTQVYVLDEGGQPVPGGVVGELYIGGEGLAKGYRNRVELTAERFVERDGERLYRTGDLVRRRKDGNLEWMGRVDQQVKLRGYRVELQEIEAALEQQAGVEQAVVVVRNENGDGGRLTGYVTAAPGAAVESGAVRKGLRAVLPEHMIPAAIVVLDQFPLTPNRKVDRNALPAPETSPNGTVPLWPRTTIENQVATIWQDLLRSPHVGINDNFFDLGGHSLLVVQLQSRLRRQFKREIPLADLFQHPTVAMIAGLLGQETKSAGYAQNTLVAQN
jgi:amino acid adenylation domain-containing protein